MKYQVCRPLTPIEYATLKASIAESGVLVPIEVDENGDILDGHHRVQAWGELRAEGYPLPEYAHITRFDWSEEQKRNHARKLNLLRRQMSKEERERMLADILKDGGTLQEAADAVGVTPMTVRSTLENYKVERPAKVKGKDGKMRRTTYAPRKPVLAPGNSLALDLEAAKETVEASRQSAHVSNNSGNNEWYTPIDFVEAARLTLGTIELDPATSEEANAKIRAETYYTIDDDGLVKEWRGKVWMNPPYAVDLVEKFTEKLIGHFRRQEVSEAIVLVNNATETQWFQSLASNAAAICFPCRRIRFWSPNGGVGAPLQGQAILYLGHNTVDFMDNFHYFGLLVKVA